MPRDLFEEIMPKDLLASNAAVEMPSLDNAQTAEDVLISLGLGNEIEKINAHKEKIKNRKGIAGLATDIALGAYNAVPAGVEFAYNLPENLYEAGKLTLQNPGLAKRYAKAGLASGIGGLLNMPSNIVNYAKEKGLAPSYAQGFNPEKAGLLPKDFDYLAAEGLTEPNKGGEFIYGASQFAPASVFGGLAPAAWAIGQNENPITAQLMPKASHAIIKPVASKAISGIKNIKNIDLTPSGYIASYVKNNISLSELADNIKAAEGTNTPLGDVTKSPYLKKKLENNVAYQLPYETEQVFKKINDQIQAKADEVVFDQIGKGIPNIDTNPVVKDVLKKAYQDNRTIKNNLYNKASEIAANENFEPDLSNFQKLVSANASTIAESPLLKTNADFSSTFNKLTKINNAIASNGQVLGNNALMINKKPPVISLTEANIVANDLYDMGQTMVKSPNAIDRAQGELYKKLANTLRSDVNHSIETKGSAELKKANNDAKTYYKDDFVQFLDKDLYKLLDETKDPNAIVNNIIKPSKRIDNAALIEKVQKVLPADKKGLLGYTYLRGAIDKYGVLQPAQVKSLINALGKRQFEALFPDKDIRQAILDFTKLHNMNSEAAGYLLNLKNGSRNQTFLKDLVSWIPESVATIAGGSMTAGTAGGLIGGLLGLVGTKMIKNASNKYMLDLLTSEEFRNKVGKKVKSGQNQKSSPTNIPQAKFAAATKKKEDQE